MFNFVSQMSNLVLEKELGLRQALRNMGMRDSSYWVSWALFDVIFSFLIALLLVIFGEKPSLHMQRAFFAAAAVGGGWAESCPLPVPPPLLPPFSHPHPTNRARQQG